ncbi:hypothetical protein SMD44_p10236 (plasmid) [Streptomyces alboflavus]|uniref:Uncharacterized protein n=1 Tax=Streptomyces alboflavus TaxID=67267 RepID=A0A291W3M8_9ACTN|nr:hypothetical protein [Streptomyces alboflavus]ATM24735.1 hypothetical protein SMD44_p10236 [Streptomyces alboflavus]
MTFIMSARSLTRLDQAALRAAQRLEDGHPDCATAGTTPPTASFATAESARRMLRRTLRLKPWVAIASRSDEAHPLADDAIGRAFRLRLSSGAAAREFLAAYDGNRRLALSIIGACPQCGAQVPTVYIKSLADYGNWLRLGPSLGESAHFRTSPAHQGGCPIPHQPLNTPA